MKDLLNMNNSSFCEVSEKELFEVEGGWNPLEELGNAVIGELVKMTVEGTKALAEYVVGFNVGLVKGLNGKGK